MADRYSTLSSKASWNPQDRGRSLVSMRAFYAYGARSTSIGSSRSSAASAHFSMPAHYNAPGYTHRSLRSSVTPASSSSSPFVRNAFTRATISGSRISDLPLSIYRPRYVSPVPCTTRISTPSKMHSPMERLLPVSTGLASSPVYSPERSSSRATSHAGYESRASGRESRESRPASVTDRDSSTAAQTPAPTQDESKLVELDTLRSKNRHLEEELAKLQLLLRDGDRSNRELKRRLFESEAETKVWRNKAERVPEREIVEVLRPAMTSDDAARHEDIDASLYDKLETTADKLARLNAVNDLKLLQSHIESALTEITSK